MAFRFVTEHPCKLKIKKMVVVERDSAKSLSLKQHIEDSIVELEMFQEEREAKYLQAKLWNYDVSKLFYFVQQT